MVDINNAWGAATQEVYANGYITVTYANANAQSNFANSMIDVAYAGTATSNTGNTNPTGTGGGGSGGSGSGSGSGGGSSGMNFGTMFGTAAQTMQDMWKRLAMTQEQTVTQQHKQLNQSQVAQTQNQINKDAMNGQDPTQAVQQLISGVFSISTQ